MYNRLHVRLLLSRICCHNKLAIFRTMMSEWGYIKVVREEVELKTVLACGQSFRWKKNELNVDEGDHCEWIGVFAHHLWILKQDNDAIKYKAYKDEVFIKSNKNYDSLLREYFQLDVSLSMLYKDWAARDAKFAELTLTDYQGIRILKQDPIETIFAFICSSNNNISRIGQMVEKLCVFYGEKIIELNGKIYYDFPKVEKLVGPDVEKKCRAEGFGYRAGFISKSAAIIVSRGGEEWTEGLKKLEYNEARKELQSLVGVGRKVADCICLMALGFHECIPVDTHMHQIGKQYLPHLSSVKTLTDKVYSEISDYFRGIHGDYAGWAHSVLFTSTLRHLKSNPTEKLGNRKKGKSKQPQVKPESGNDSTSIIKRSKRKR